MSLDVYLSYPPCEHCGNSERDVFDANITHNLNAMAEAAGIYKALWRPEENGITHARQLVEILQRGLEWLREHEAEARKLEPPNRWGTYEDFIPWIERYRDACIANPKAEVRVSR